MEFSAYLADSLDFYGGARSGEEGKEEIGCSEAIRKAARVIRISEEFARSRKISYSRMITLHVRTTDVNLSCIEMQKSGWVQLTEMRSA